MDKKRILLIGRRQEVLDQLSVALEQEGFKVKSTHDIEQLLENYHAMDYDLVISGAGVDDTTKERLKAEFRRQNPAVLILDGLAPIVPILADQIKYAFLEKPDEKKLLIHFNCEVPDDLHIRFSVKAHCYVTVTLFYFDYTNGQTYQEKLLSEAVEGGEHTVTASKKLLGQGPNFIVLKINNDEFFLQRMIVH